jgi:hypothetical protein
MSAFIKYCGYCATTFTPPLLSPLRSPSEKQFLISFSRVSTLKFSLGYLVAFLVFRSPISTGITFRGGGR